MHPRHDPSDGLRLLAGLQSGVVTRQQVLAHGLPARSVQRLVASQHWERRANGLYSTAPVLDTFESRAWAGILAAGDEAMLGEHSAGHVQGIAREVPDEVVVLVGQNCGRKAPTGVRFVRRRHLPRPRGLLPCTPVEWTVVDLCASEPERIEEWVTTALRERLTTSERLLAQVHTRRRLPSGVRRHLVDLLEDVEGVESPLERLFIVKVLRAHGLPQGERQAWRQGSRHDIRIGPLLVELDGRRGHAGATDVFRDMGRDNGALVDGFVTLRYGWSDCWNRQCEVAGQVEAVLARLGVPTTATRCPSCPPDLRL